MSNSQKKIDSEYEALMYLSKEIAKLLNSETVLNLLKMGTANPFLEFAELRRIGTLFTTFADMCEKILTPTQKESIESPMNQLKGEIQ